MCWKKAEKLERRALHPGNEQGCRCGYSWHLPAPSWVREPEGESSLEEEEEEVTPLWPFPRAEIQAACKTPQNRIFNCNYNTLQSTRLVCRWFYFLVLFLPFGVLVVFFSPNISFVAEDYIPNGVFLSAVLYTALLFKELAWILTTLQAGNLVGALFCCLLIYHWAQRSHRAHQSRAWVPSNDTGSHQRTALWSKLVHFTE